jgi:hypothetical protein
MRVLPYFKSSLPVRTAPAARKIEKNAESSSPPELKAAASQAPAEDMFIPTSPVTGVVYSIEAKPAEKEGSSGVVKLGHYSFYRLDGRAEQTKQPQMGLKLDLKG